MKLIAQHGLSCSHQLFHGDILFLFGFILFGFKFHHSWHNFNPRLVTKAKACKVARQEGSPRVMLHAFGSARECEGIDPHTLKGTPTIMKLIAHHGLSCSH
jgi:hypothetical protein